MYIYILHSGDSSRYEAKRFVHTRSGVEIDGGLMGLLTTVPFGGAARGAIDQRVPLVGYQPSRMVHIQCVEVAHAVVRPRRGAPRVAHPVVHLVHSHLVVVLAARRERF